MSGRILIVDDEAESRDGLVELTRGWGWAVQTASSGREGLRRAIEWHPEVVLTDLVMPNMDGLWLLRALRAELPESPVVLLTGRGTIQTAVQAIKEGAFDFIEKPLDVSRLRIVLERARERTATKREVDVLRQRLAALARDGESVGSGPAMTKVHELVAKVAPSNASVVITGESGTGKEVAARAIHRLSPRREKAFVALSCSAIPSTLIEAELFGWERGAFTGADQRRLGNLELAHEGTLFLDEIGELPLELQAKFLRVLEERRIRRLGGRSEVEIDVRVVCATNRDLKREIREGRFREDLYFRLAVFAIHMPRLADRPEDIPLLAQGFVERFRAETGKRVRGFTPRALALLGGHAWPGNVRELRNAVERATILADGDLIGEEHLPPEIAAGGAAAGTLTLRLGAPMAEVEKEYILASLARNGGNKARTAALLGISEKTLYNKLNRYAAEARDRAAEGPGPAPGGGGRR